MTTLTVTLGFNGSLRLLYPNGKSIDLPPGDAEARMLEILQGFRKDLKTIRREQTAKEAISAIETAMATLTREPNPHNLPQVRRFGPLLRPNREITLEELGLGEA